jgi:hypothetical protein
MPPSCSFIITKSRQRKNETLVIIHKTDLLTAVLADLGIRLNLKLLFESKCLTERKILT